jgi:hypothetical protein
VSVKEGESVKEARESPLGQLGGRFLGAAETKKAADQRRCFASVQQRLWSRFAGSIREGEAEPGSGKINIALPEVAYPALLTSSTQ